MATTFTLKVIKPGKLNVEPFRRAMLNAVEGEGKVQQNELRKTVSTWHNKPKFDSLTSITRGNLTVITGPTGDVEAVKHWNWVDEGTRPHIIRARRAPYLRFKAGSRPKTTPRKFGSGSGSPGTQWIRKQSVRHPGTKPREWAKLLSERRKDKFRKNVIEGLQRATKRAFQE